MDTTPIIGTVLVAALVYFLQNRRRSITPASNNYDSDDTHFVYVKIIDPVTPIERIRKYEDPLGRMLDEQKLGEIIGGGTMQNKDKNIEFVGIDLELINLDAALDATRVKLRELGVPKGSVLEYRRNGEEIVLEINDG